MESTNPVPSLSSNIPINNRPGDISQRPSRETTAPVAKFGRYHVFEYEVLTCREKIVQSFLIQSRFHHNKDDPTLKKPLTTSIYFGTPIIQHAALCIPVCWAIGKFLSMREIVTLACMNSEYRLLISSLVENYYSHSPAIQANYRSLWQSDFTSPPEQLTLWLEKYFDKSDKAWVEEDALRQAALHRCLSNKADNIKYVTTPERVYRMDTLPGGKIATCSGKPRNDQLKIWSLTKAGGAQCVAILSGHTKQIKCILGLPNNQVITGSEDCTLRVWDLTRPEGEQCIAILKGHSGWVNDVTFFRNCRRFISGSHDRTLRAWDLTQPEGEQCVAILDEHSSWISSITMLSDDRFISSTLDCTLKVWDVTRPEGERCVATLAGHIRWLDCVVVHPNGQIISGSRDCTLKVWDETKPAGEQCVTTLYGHSLWIECIEVLANGRIVTGSGDCTLRVWDLARPGEERCVAVLRGHSCPVRCILVLADGRILTSDSRTLRIWDLAKPEGEEYVVILRRHPTLVKSIKRLPNGQIISFSHDGSLRVWSSAFIDPAKGLLPDMPGKESDSQASNESCQEPEQPRENSRESDSWYKSCEVM